MGWAENIHAISLVSPCRSYKGVSIDHGEVGEEIGMSPKSRGSSCILLDDVTGLLSATISLLGILAGVLYDVEALLEKVITLRQADINGYSSF
jgi:hypothetical protein